MWLIGEATVGMRELPVELQDLVVDTAATYTVLPRKVLESLGVTAKSRVEIGIADGSVIYRGMGEKCD